MKKPVTRSALRLTAGRMYFSSKKRLQWAKKNRHLAKVKSTELLPFVIFSHHTPLLRKLKNVDMWLQYNKIINLKIALKHIDKLIIKPGETFSYWYSIGKPTKRKGYVPGMILEKGGFKPGIGGGLCQLSNLLYWTALHSPLHITERWRHGYDVFPDSNRTQPFGSGATCSYNYIDLQIKNETPYTFQWKISITKTDLKAELRSDNPNPYTYEIYEKDHHIIHEPWGGYVRHNELWKKTIDPTTHTTRADERVAINNAIMMYNPLLK